MKKLLMVCLLFITAIALVACNNRVTARITSVSATSETVIIEVIITDTDSQIVANSLIARPFLQGISQSGLDDRNPELVNQTTNTWRFRVTGLIHDTTYNIRILATIGGVQTELARTNATTLDVGATVDNPIKISTPDEFLAMRDSSSSFFILKNDIDFAGRTIQAENFFATSTSAQAFRGNLDGAGFAVRNLNLETASRPQFLGLFGFINTDANREQAAITDLTLDNVNFLNATYHATVHAGILAGRLSNTSRVENITVRNSSLTLDLRGNAATPSNIGGIIGQVEGSVKNVTTINTSIDVHLGGVNSVNIGGALGVLFHTSNPRVSSNIISDGQITFRGLISSQQPRPTVVNIGGAIGNYNLPHPLTGIASNANILVENFLFTGREVQTTEDFRRTDDSLRVGGLIGNASTNFLISDGLYSGSIDVTSNDIFGRIEEVFVSGLIARSENTLNTKNLVRLGAGQTINVNTGEFPPQLFVSDVETFRFDGNSTLVGNVYDESLIYINNQLGQGTDVTPGNGIDNITNDFILTQTDIVQVGVNRLRVFASEVVFNVFITDYLTTINTNNVVVRLLQGTNIVDEVAYNLFNGSFSNLQPNTEYQILIVYNNTNLTERTFTTSKYYFYITESTTNPGESSLRITYNSIAFNFEVRNTDGAIDTATVIVTLFDNGLSHRTSASGSTTINFARALRPSTNYVVEFSAEINGVRTVFDRFTFRSVEAVVANTSPVTVTSTTISFDLNGTVINETQNLNVNYNTLRAALFVNFELIDSIEIQTSYDAVYNVKFDNLAPNTIYRLVLIATVDGQTNFVFGSIGNEMYETSGIEASIDESSIQFDLVADNPASIDLSFNISLIDDGAATNIQVELWHNGSIQRPIFNVTDINETIRFLNLREGAVVEIRITAVVNGTTRTIGQQTITIQRP